MHCETLTLALMGLVGRDHGESFVEVELVRVCVCVCVCVCERERVRASKRT